MPTIFLSPSTQEYNQYVTGAGSEEYFMNLLADAMEPLLLSNGIQFTRNDPQGTVSDSIRQSNAGSYDFHLALHSNASGPGSEGRSRGIVAFYYPGSANSQRAAELFAAALREIYPLPNQVTTRSTTTLAEVKRTKAPAVLLEIGYHDNAADARWIQENVQNIAENLSQSLAEYFGLPFIYPMPVRTGVVTTESTGLNLRADPSMTGQVVGSVPPRAQLTVYGQTDGWYSVAYGDLAGYVRADYVRLT